MIRVKMNFVDRLKILFGWKLHIELVPCSSTQSYFQYYLPPWRPWSYEFSKPGEDSQP